MENFIYGKIPVKNALNSNRIPKLILLNAKSTDREIEKICKQKGINIKYVMPDELNKMTNHANHQGMILYLSEFKYSSLESILKSASKKTDSTIVLLDSISDPVNFGSIIRSSTFFLADGIIIAKNRQVEVTPTVVKVATGAEEYMKICSVTNLVQTIKKLKSEGYFVVSTSDKGNINYDEINYKGKIVLVIGNEGKGVSRLVLENSDYIAKIPTNNNISSLNANVAAACFLSMINSYRNKH